ncbi:MAG: hypothetical protein LBC71_04105 [Oscillospiraceae bacterium]|jgi:hypothetical protein|nr:hypothetical protein [Oscillospiraceae bacterium]
MYEAVNKIMTVSEARKVYPNSHILVKSENNNSIVEVLYIGGEGTDMLRLKKEMNDSRLSAILGNNLRNLFVVGSVTSGSS